MRIKRSFYILFFSILIHFVSSAKLHYYCVPSDERHFPLLINLIGSIHEVDYDNLGEIAVYDLGMTSKQIEIVKKIKKVSLHKPEQVHPDLCKYFKTCKSGRMVKGWFAWKPVVMKQALDLFPHVLYLDAGSIVLKSPVKLFEHIENEGYFLMTAGSHNIIDRSTKYVNENLIYKSDQCEKLLAKDTYMIDAGMQGVSRIYYDKYLKPVYEAAQDLNLFADDGSAPMGLGAGRHDQTLFSIYAHMNNMKIHPQGWIDLVTNGTSSSIHIHWNRSDLEKETVIYRSRWDVHYLGSKDKYIKYKGDEAVNFSMNYWIRNSSKHWSKFIN